MTCPPQHDEEGVNWGDVVSRSHVHVCTERMYTPFYSLLIALCAASMRLVQPLLQSPLKALVLTMRTRTHTYPQEGVSARDARRSFFPSALGPRSPALVI